MQEIRTVSPPELTARMLRGKTTLVLGAPYIGKTHQVKSLAAMSADIKRIERLPSFDEFSSDITLIIDDFYSAYINSSPERCQELPKLLAREAGICLVTRPRNLDWMLQQESRLSPADISRLTCTILLRYDPNQSEDQKRATDICLNIAEDNLDRSKVSDSLDDLLYPSYTYENVWLEDQLNIYESTLLPPLVEFISDQLGRSESETLLTGERVRTVLTDIGSDFGFGEFVDGLKQVGSQILASRELQCSTTPLLGMAPPLASIVGGLALYRALQEDDHERKSIKKFLDQISNETLTPDAEEHIETQFELPPRTITHLRWLTREDNLHRIQAAAKKMPELQAKVDRQIARWTAIYGDRLTDIETTVENLEAAQQKHSELNSFIVEELAKSVHTLEYLEQEFRTEEEALLQTKLSDLDFRDDVPYYGDEEDRIVEAVDGNNKSSLIVLKGPHGTGKTAASYRAGRELLNRGYTIRLPNFDKPVNFVKRALEAASLPLVLITSYRVGDSPFSDEQTFKQLLSWLNDGICRSVIIQCRDEFYDDFTDISRRIDLNKSQHEIWENHKELIRFKPLTAGSNEKRTAVPVEEDDGTAEHVVSWVLDRFDIKNAERRDEIITQAAQLANGNVEIAKIATRFAISADQPLVDVESVDELIWRDLQKLFSNRSVRVDGIPRGEQVFQPLCFARRLTTRELLAITPDDVTVQVLEKVAKPLAGYLGGEVATTIQEPTSRLFLKEDGNEVWEVSPDLYAEVALLRYGIEEDNLGWFLNELRRQDLIDIYPRVSLNLSMVAAEARNRKETDLLMATSTYADHLLKDIFAMRAAPETLVNTLLVLSHSVPLDPKQLYAEHNQVFDALSSDKLSLESAHTLTTILGLVLANRRGVNSDLDEAVSIVIRFADHDQQPIDTGQFLANSYSYALTDLVTDLVIDPQSESIKNWIDDLETQIIRTASDERQPLRSGQFIGNIYSMTIRRLAEDYQPPTIETGLNDLEERMISIACDNRHCADTGRLLKNIYANAIRMLAEEYEPETVEIWLDDLEDRMIRTASDNRQPADVGEFMANAYSIVIANLAEDYQPDLVKTWLNSLEDRMVSIACYDQQPLGVGEFIANIYSETIFKIITSNQPDVVEVWLDDLEQRMIRVAIDDNHPADPEYILVNVYSQVFSKLVQDHEPETVEIWLDDLEDRMIRTAADNRQPVATGPFLENIYSNMISQLSDESRPEEAKAWLDEFEDRAIRTAYSARQPVDATIFLKEVYSMAITRIITNNPSRTLEAWIDVLLERPIMLASDNPEWLNRDSFAPELLATATIRIPPTLQIRPEESGRSYLFGSAMSSLSNEELYPLYNAYQKFSREPADLYWMIDDLLDRTVYRGERILSTQTECIDFAATIFADLLFHPLNPRDYVIKSVANVATADVMLYSTIIRKVSEKITAEHISSLLTDEPIDYLEARQQFVVSTYTEALQIIAQADDSDERTIDLLDSLKQQTEGMDASKEAYLQALIPVLERFTTNDDQEELQQILYHSTTVLDADTFQKLIADTVSAIDDSTDTVLLIETVVDTVLEDRYPPYNDAELIKITAGAAAALVSRLWREQSLEDDVFNELLTVIDPDRHPEVALTVARQLKGPKYHFSFLAAEVWLEAAGLKEVAEEE